MHIKVSVAKSMYCTDTDISQYDRRKNSCEMDKRQTINKQQTHRTAIRWKLTNSMLSKTDKSNQVTSC